MPQHTKPHSNDLTSRNSCHLVPPLFVASDLVPRQAVAFPVAAGAASPCGTLLAHLGGRRLPSLLELLRLLQGHKHSPNNTCLWLPWTFLMFLKKNNMTWEKHNCQCSWKKGGGFAAGHDSHSIPATKACMYNDSWKTSSITSWCQEPPASVGVRWCDVWSFPLHSTPISANDGTMIGMIGKVARFFMSHMQIWFTDPITFMTFPTRLPNNSFHLFHPLHPCLVGVRILAHVQRWNQDQYPAAVAPPKCSSPQRWGVEGLRFTPTKFRRMPIDWRFEKGLHTKRTPLGSGNSHHPNRLHSSLPCITSMLIVVPFWGGTWPSWKASQMVKVDRACYYHVVAGLVWGPFFEPSERIDGDLPLHCIPIQWPSIWL